MKKIILFSAVSLLALASCKKDYTCTVDILGTEVVTDYPGLTKDQAEKNKEACEVIGTWAVK